MKFDRWGFDDPGNREQGTGNAAAAIPVEMIKTEYAAATIPVPCSLFPVPYKSQFNAPTE